MEDIKISIITASYNYQDYIKGTIESILNQTYPNWELIVVDDGSTDNSIEIIKSYVKKDKRIKLFTHKNNENKGLAETIKFAITKTKYDWIAFLESDDKFRPDCLKQKVDAIKKHKKIELIFSDYEMFGDSEEIKNKTHYQLTNKKYLNKDGFKNLTIPACKGNPIATFSIVMLKKELLKDVDFNSPIKAFLDFYLRSQIITKTKTYYIDKKLTYRRMHKTSYVHNENGDVEKFRKNINKFLNKSFLYRIFYLFEILRKIKKEKISIKFGSKAHIKIFNFKIGKNV